MKFKLATHTQEEEIHLNYYNQINVIVIFDLFIMVRLDIVLFNNCSIHIDTDLIKLILKFVL